MYACVGVSEYRYADGTLIKRECEVQDRLERVMTEEKKKQQTSEGKSEEKKDDQVKEKEAEKKDQGTSKGGEKKGGEGKGGDDKKGGDKSDGKKKDDKADKEKEGDKGNGKESSKQPEMDPKERAEKMEEYDKLKKELKEMISKKRTLDKNLNNLEEQIYKYEGSYLEDTQNGNVIKGFDNYIKNNPNKRRATFSEQDRLFSLSSAVFLKVKMKEEDGQA